MNEDVKADVVKDLAGKMLNVGELFDAWKEAYKKAYGEYPRIKLIGTSKEKT